MVRGRSVVSSLWLVLSFVVTPPIARAQDARAEARAHFIRGVELFDEGRNVEALAEFEEAYRISPAPNLLYNLAQIHADLGHAVEAVDAYERFLRDASGLDRELRAEVEAALSTQRARIGRVHVEAAVAGARVFLDDVEVGATPLDPVRVSAGEHLLVLQAAGFETQRHRFRVAGGATYEANLTLVPSGSRGASLRIESLVPGIDIRVDGASMGLTPLDATVPVSAGSHRVEGVREGYVPFALEVTTSDGSETRVVVQTRVDERAPASTRAPLRIALPSTSSAVSIDGEGVSAAASLELPVGLHDVEIRAAEREPVEVRIDLLGEGYELAPPYAWTPDARARRIAGADAMRAGGVGTLIAGAASLGGALAVLIWDLTSLLPSLEERNDDANVCGDPIGGVVQCEIRLMRRGYTGGPMAFVDQYLADQTTYNLLLGVSVTGVALGAIGVVAGSILLATAPSNSDIDRGARADFSLELDLGLGRVGVHGTF